MFGKSIDLDVSQAILDRLQSWLFHRSDSIQGTDYIASDYIVFYSWIFKGF